MITTIKQFVNEKKEDIILVTGVMLISLLSFFLGYIVAKDESKDPIEIQYEQNESSYNWSWNIRA